MQRCLELAKRGAGLVAPNPMVGAVLVYNECIIGEGWHQQYGGPHAEANAIHHAIQSGQKDLSQSTLYVSLEPCAHFGKTPPCADLIIEHKIPKVVIGCRDPFKEVNGKGIEKLIVAGVTVEVGIMENESKESNKRFFTFHTQKRPYIILKWAQTGDGKVAASSNSSKGGNLNSANSRLLISNEYSNKIVHQWRSEEAAILVGTNTALLDNPELTTRLFPGSSPVRLVIDMNLRLPDSLKLFDRKVKTIVFNNLKNEESENLVFYKLESGTEFIPQLLQAFYQLNLLSVLVEGGVKLLQSFINAGAWDEIRVISNSELQINDGLTAPVITNAVKMEEQLLLTDKVEIYKQKNAD